MVASVEGLGFGGLHGRGEGLKVDRGMGLSTCVSSRTSSTLINSFMVVLSM